MIFFLVLSVALLVLLLACFLLFHLYCCKRVLGHQSYLSELEECNSVHVHRNEVEAGFVRENSLLLKKRLNNMILPFNYFCHFKRCYAESGQITGQIVTGHETEKMDLEYEIKSTQATNGCKHAVFVI